MLWHREQKQVFSFMSISASEKSFTLEASLLSSDKASLNAVFRPIPGSEAS
jgi:hypothetical protein